MVIHQNIPVFACGRETTCTWCCSLHVATRYQILFFFAGAATSVQCAFLEFPINWPGNQQFFIIKRNFWQLKTELQAALPTTPSLKLIKQFDFFPNQHRIFFSRSRTINNLTIMNKTIPPFDSFKVETINVNIVQQWKRFSFVSIKFS